MAHEHSKGPFTLKIEGDQVRIYAADGYDMVSVPLDPEHGRPGEDEANARLFAGSADLLVLAQAAAACLDPDVGEHAVILDRIKDVIDLIKGGE